MKNIIAIVCLVLLLTACKKDKFTTAPQISFVDLKPNFAPIGLTNIQESLIPKLVFKITDAEGDFGNNDAGDSSWIYVKHLFTQETDSLRFPDLQRAPKNNFDAEVTVSMFTFIECAAGQPRPGVDTVFYEVYVKDAKGNKSNVIKTGKPLLTECP
ncbi:MAG: hypothetical protein EOO06_02260 [Chitinophagaceae bacterium]|nr:MAG: hypothetical protein EOO06_02260 [Chitinophagaceae bacterium]